MDLEIPDNINSNKYNSLLNELRVPSLQECVFLSECNREITFIRDDQIHPVISGNKWRKLKYHLGYYLNNDYQGIASMGGAYSNHLHALAYVCQLLDVPCSLFVYGLHGEMNSPTLMDCNKWNAGLNPISRNQAADFRLNGLNCLPESMRSYYWIEEGGGGVLGESGMKDLIDELPAGFDKKETLIVCATGTGTTIKGILRHTSNCRIATLQVVKMARYTWANNERIIQMSTGNSHAFAKQNDEMASLIIQFSNSYHIQLDKVYTAPLMQSFLKNENLHQFQNIYFIHSGGLQGNRVY